MSNKEESPKKHEEQRKETPVFKEPDFKPADNPDLPTLPEEIVPEEVQVLLDSFSPEEKEIVAHIVSVAVTRSSPIPDPSSFKAYNDIDPSITKHIMDDFSETRRHRRDMELFTSQSEVSYKKRGQDYALLITISMIIAGVLIAIFSNFIGGSIITALGAIVGLIKAFLNSSLYSHQKDNQPEEAQKNDVNQHRSSKKQSRVTTTKPPFKKKARR